MGKLSLMGNQRAVPVPKGAARARSADRGRAI